MKIFHFNSTKTLLLMFLLIGSSVYAQAASRDEIVFFLPDALGSAIAAVNENGDLCWQETYTPYGDKTVNGDLVAELGMPDGCGLLGEERGYTGHTEDFESDLVYAQQRYYDPTVGRFMSVDPVSIDPFDIKTINRYSYAANNPYKYTDPNGESFRFIITGFKVLRKGIKNKGNFKDAAADELLGAVDDISTLLDGKLDLNDLGAIADLALGTEFSSKKTSVPKGGTYKLRDADGVVKRTGKSNDLNRRRGEHARNKDTKDLDFEVDRRSDCCNAQRGREQIIYDKHPEAQAANGGLNKRRPVSPTNKNRDIYRKAGEKL